MSDETIINGDSVDVTVKLPEEHLEDLLVEQLTTMGNSTSMENPIVVMPDTHPGSGSVVGFTTELGEKVIPNAVGVDVGCGMEAWNLGSDNFIEYALEQSDQEAALTDIDTKIREHVPFGFSVHDDQDYHIKNDFPWTECNETLREFVDEYREQGGSTVDMDTFVNDGGYNIQYLKNLRKKLASETRIGMSRIIDSMGTLGGGNHFIEIGESQETGDYWVIIHSGSRKLGLAVAKYHQQQAINRRAEKEINEGLDSLDVPERYIESVGSKGVQPDVDVIRDELDGEQIEETIQEIHDIGVPDDFNEDLAHLEGKDAEAYLIDMIFAQQYALESRRQMAEAVRSVVDGEKKDTITSVHNFIDFRDLVIRKGATSAHEGERLIIPFNMRDGTIIARGLGNEQFNRSAPHGAGRLGSRRWAHESFSDEEVQESMADVFSTGIPTDEAPMAYKPMDLIEKHIEPTAEIVDRIVPVMNLKSLA